MLWGVPAVSGSAGERIQCCLCEDASSTPSLPQRVKDTALLHDAVKCADVAWIWCCHGWGTALSQSLAQELLYATGVAVKT